MPAPSILAQISLLAGLAIDWSLFRGAEIAAASMKSLFAGGVSFATPPDPGPLASDGLVFQLHDELREEWFEWAPAISLPTDH